uniref:Leucine-rich repeat-containing N-terminal plant-type domain-containing protein n=1 Tax=Oryza rufipogon TaxID=4529 RepID=A0A0E0NZX4_ORYRU
MGRVTAINASRGGLVASLNGTDLSKLAFLSDLDLSFNELDDDLPVLPAPLPRLLSLDLRSNSFYSIPDGFFAGFPALQTFAFDDNAMLIKDIPNDVVTCSNLRSFTANNASIYGTFPDYFGNATLFPRLERLNRLTGPIRDGFGRKSSIKYLDIGGQRDFDGGGESSLNSRIDLFIPDMESLVEARLDHNAFTGPVPDATRLVNLRVFDASYNDLCAPLLPPSSLAAAEPPAAELPPPPPQFELLDLRYFTVDLSPDHITEVKSTGHCCSTFDVCVAKTWQARTCALIAAGDAEQERRRRGNCFYPVLATGSSGEVAGADIVDVVRIIRDAKARLAATKLPAAELPPSPPPSSPPPSSLAVVELLRHR